MCTPEALHATCCDTHSFLGSADGKVGRCGRQERHREPVMKLQKSISGGWADATRSIPIAKVFSHQLKKARQVRRVLLCVLLHRDELLQLVAGVIEPWSEALGKQPACEVYDGDSVHGSRASSH